jgi:N-acetylglucosamine kinase-like BadF-type ATPase
MQDSPFLLAVDGGGTKTQALCVTPDGEVVGEGMSGPTSLAATSVGAASFNLREAIRQATQQILEENEEQTFQYLVMGLAGMDTPPEEARARQAFQDILEPFGVEEFQLVNDIVIALESGTDAANAVALIAGTGSNCYGHNAAGKQAKTGGMDYLLTDQGSAYAIGRAALRAAVKSYDGRIPHTPLEELVRDHFGIASLSELKTHVYNPVLSKPEVADIAPLVTQALEDGDEVAEIIMVRAVDELFMLVETVLQRLELLGEDVDCVMVGGVSEVPFVHERLEAMLEEVCPKINVISPDIKPVQGAVKMVRQLHQRTVEG